MKKRVFVMMLTAACVLSGCGVSDYKDGIESAAEIAGEVVDATKDIAGNVADAAGIDKDEVKQTIKDATSELKDQARETASEVADKAVDVSKEILKDYAKDKLKGVTEEALKSESEDAPEAVYESASDFVLTDTDGAGENYTFDYDGETFSAFYTPDNWKIIGSYRINNASDMLIICQGLIDVHPVHGKDMVSFRTAEDMVYEWQIHNLAVKYLEDDDPLKAHAADVDFDPEDQGITIEEFYKSRTGKDLDLSEFLNG